MTYIELELYHHGIKGQRWGVRRFQNKDGSLTPAGKQRVKVSNKQIREERKHLSQQYYKTESKSSSAKLKSLYDEADQLARTYDFDQDDGGGGTSAASRRAGRRYMKIWDEISEIENSIDYRVRQKTGQALVEKYGKERVDRFERQEAIATGATVIGVLVGLPITASVLIGLASGSK